MGADADRDLQRIIDGHVSGPREHVAIASSSAKTRPIRRTRDPLHIALAAAAVVVSVGVTALAVERSLSDAPLRAAEAELLERQASVSNRVATFDRAVVAADERLTALDAQLTRLRAVRAELSDEIAARADRRFATVLTEVSDRAAAVRLPEAGDHAFDEDPASLETIARALDDARRAGADLTEKHAELDAAVAEIGDLEAAVLAAADAYATVIGAMAPTLDAELTLLTDEQRADVAEALTELAASVRAGTADEQGAQNALRVVAAARAEQERLLLEAEGTDDSLPPVFVPPGGETPAPDPTTPAPDPTTPAPDPTTPAPDPTTPAPDPEPTTPAPDPDPEPEPEPEPPAEPDPGIPFIPLP
ncbi:hypothetical protein [Microbacterium dauci]|uniref:Uncharacterized protein n=1 Tax=Microbacterium dauci TaxID=3048008 RepID=A0ABT6ZEB0_9MICO|nr:hypothetical protein [Microbacterium sp. LX3-4]MDJ1114501.1 hypothetical protein [Microbacterium sp. LX3-4]